jgi:predicted lipid-binding transport protein (Tim44 family)
MTRRVSLISLLMVLMIALLPAADAWARAGRGGFSGSRGSRSFSSPVRPSPSPIARPAPMPGQPPAPARPGWGAGLLGGIGGLLVGGLIGSMLFGGMGHGFGGGVGLLELLLIGGLAAFVIASLRRRREPEPALAGYGGARVGGAQGWPTAAGAPADVLDTPGAPTDLETGLAHLRQMDPSFEPGGFAATASDIFFRIQAAWTVRDMGGVRELLTPEMAASLQGQCDRLRADHLVNRLENIAVRECEVTEAWQESGWDFVTVHFLASVLDYTVAETGNEVVEGSRTEPVKFEEYWTFTRRVGPNRWTLSAIQQAP